MQRDARRSARVRHVPALAVFLALLAIAAPLARATPATSVSPMRALDARLAAQINAVRVRHGLRPLRVSRELAAAASLHSREMARLGFFSHTSRDGKAFWKRIERFYRPRGARVWAVGENLIWQSPDLDAREAVAAWMKSPGHRRVLLDPSWREVGLSAVHSVAAAGVFDGMDVTLVTADFGVRR